jgi:hypothetical protein
MIQTLTGSNELDAFYKDKFYFSYSSISKLLFSPAAFYNHYVLKQREDVVAPHLVSGRVLHCLLFEPEKYDDNFISMPGKLPTDSQRKIIDNIFKKYLEINNNTLTLADFSDDILTELLTANLYQSLKTDLQRTEKILTEENKNYFTFLIDSQDKTLVDEPTLNNCKSGVEVLKSNEEVRSLLQLDKSEEDVHIESYSELPIEANAEHLPFGKPHPQVYLNCAEALGSNVHECICFEDSFNGLIAAKSARMRCVVVPHHSQIKDERWGAADLKLSSLQNFGELHFGLL